ncbi:MAG: hypothetical protein INR72_19960 [Williamsia herbipolensis]|nr:hypothetical protein [Williamsia herbipolensis]
MDDLAGALELGRVLLLDVRSSEDVAAGHIPGSWLIPAAALAGRIRDPDDPFFQALRRAVSPVAVVAGHPDRFAATVAMLAEVSVEAVAVAGEITAWSRAGRPLNQGRAHGPDAHGPTPR